MILELIAAQYVSSGKSQEALVTFQVSLAWIQESKTKSLRESHHERIRTRDDSKNQILCRIISFPELP